MTMGGTLKWLYEVWTIHYIVVLPIGIFQFSREKKGGGHSLTVTIQKIILIKSIISVAIIIIL